MGKLDLPLQVTMTGASGRLTDTAGNTLLQIPQQYKNQIKFINIQNTTDNTINIYGATDDVNTANPQYEIGARHAISINLTGVLSQGIQATFNNPNNTSPNTPKPLTAYWSDDTEGWNNSFANSFTNGSVVSIGNTPTVIIGNSPAVSVSNTVNCDESGKTWFTNTFSGAGTFTVKNTPGKVFAMQGSAAIGQQLLDGSAIAWKQGDIVGLGWPIQCNVSIQVSVTSAGTVWVLYE